MPIRLKHIVFIIYIYCIYNSTESFDGMQKHQILVPALKSFLVGIAGLLHDHDDLSAT